MIHELFEKQANRTPDKIALMFEESQLTYGELDDRAERLAHRLRSMGVGPDVLVALLIERSPDMVVGMLAILKAGGAYIPLDPGHPGSRIVSVLEDAQPLLLLTDDRSEAKLPPHRTRSVSIGAATSTEISDQGTRRQSSPSNLAYVIYTSGSTGEPKGVEIEHGAVTNFLASMKRQPGLSTGDTMLAITTLAFDIAVLEIVLPLVCGASVVIASTEKTRDGAALADLIQRRGVTVIQATPSTFRMLVDAGWMGAPQLKILCGGEAWGAELAKSLLPRCGSLWNMYGPTETTIWSAIAKVEAGCPVAIGSPIAKTRLYVLDRALQLVPLGVPGELCIGGAGLARGYLNRPELTRERFVPDPYSEEPGARIYRTGDLVRRLRDGTLEFLGRLDHQVKIRGHRVELGEVETALERHSHVKQCAVVASEDTGGERRLVGYFIPAGEAVATTSELHKWLSEQLPSYMIPSAFVALSSFPLTPSGKLDRKALPSPDRAPSKHNVSLAPSNLSEEAIAHLWCEMLNLSEVGVRDDFFDLGGNSILAARTIGRLNQTFGTNLNVSAIFSAPTVEALAALVEQNQGVDKNKSRIISFRIGQKGVPLYFVGAGPVEYQLAQLSRGDRSIFALNVPIPAEWRRAIDTGDKSVLPTFKQLGDFFGEALHAQVGSSVCVIAGYSFSGKVAFETARAMRHAGGNVALVLLIDAFSWTGLNHRRMASRILHSIWRNVSVQDGKFGSYAKFLFSSIGESGRLLWWLLLQVPPVIWSRVRKNHLPSNLVDSTGQPIELSDIFDLQQVAGKVYLPQPLDASGVLLRAQLPNEELLPEIDVTNGWGDLFLRGLEVVQAGGHHVSIVSNKQNITALAAQIDAVLDSYDRNGKDDHFETVADSRESSKAAAF
jgi:amino acid adenylation domain-containing protein